MNTSVVESESPPERRMSKLAASAFVLAGLTAPLVTFPLQLTHVALLFVLPVAPLILGIVALIRIGRQDRQLRGQTLAMAAIVLSLVWLGSTLVLVSLGMFNSSGAVISD